MLIFQFCLVSFFISIFYFRCYHNFYIAYLSLEVALESDYMVQETLHRLLLNFTDFGGSIRSKQTNFELSSVHSFS